METAMAPEKVDTDRINHIFREQHNHKPAMVRLTAKERIERIKRIRKAMFDYREQIEDAMYRDFKKHPTEVAVTELYAVINDANHTIKHLKQWMGTHKVSTPLNMLGTSGKIKYEPKAVVWHYHRATWKGFFKQQFLYGRSVPRVYLTTEHFKRISGDEISTPIKPLQIGIMFLLVLFAALIPIINTVKIVYLLASILFIFYLYQTLEITRKISEIPYFIGVFFVKNIAWCLGIFLGIIDMVFKR